MRDGGGGSSGFSHLWDCCGVAQVKKSKSLETKLRSAIRLIWSRSAERRAIIKASVDENDNFMCPICEKEWPKWAGEVDHIEPIGPLETWLDTVEFIKKMFYGPQRLVCKPCHKSKTKEDMRNLRAKRKIS